MGSKKKDQTRVKKMKAPAWIREAWAAYARDYRRRKKAEKSKNPSEGQK